jgi:hypothetical protein
MQAMAPQAAAPVYVVEVPVVEESKYMSIKSQSLEHRKPSPDKPMFVEVGNIAKETFYVIE